MSRFDKYRAEGDWPDLRKLDEGTSFTAKLTGEHDYEGKDGPVPVLEFEDRAGAKFAWRASSWHAREELAIADPQVGDELTVTRLTDRGRSHQYMVAVTQAAREPEPQPQPSLGAQFGDAPPW